MVGGKGSCSRMGKLKVLITRPKVWDQMPSDKLDVTFVPIGGAAPKLRNGRAALDEMGVVATAKGAKLLERMMDRIRPDVFLYWPHFGAFDTSLLRRLRKISPSTMFVHGSGNQVVKPHGICWYVYENHEFMDAVLTNVKDEKRKNLLRKWVPKVDTLYTFGFDPKLFTRPKDSPTVDCFFGGGNTVTAGKPKGRFPFSRFRYNLITQASRRWEVLIRGGGWHVPHHPGLQGLEYFREMQKAKIILGTYHLDLERYYTKRTVYGGASGRLYIVRYIPGMENDFTTLENIVWFRTVDGGIRMIDFYLNNPKKREQVAAQQRCHFVRNHSWEARLRDFEKVIGRLL